MRGISRLNSQLGSTGSVFPASSASVIVKDFFRYEIIDFYLSLHK